MRGILPGGILKCRIGLEVLQPKSGPAYPIPCAEWDHLKNSAKRSRFEPWFFHTLGSVFVGTAIATYVTILLGTFDKPEQDHAHTVAWAVVVVSLLTGGLSMFFAHRQRDDHEHRIADIVTQMELIEQRYERESIQ